MPSLSFGDDEAMRKLLIVAGSVAVVRVLHASHCRLRREATGAWRRDRLDRLPPTATPPGPDGASDWSLWEWELELWTDTGLDTAL